ncbi:hypothetical protein [Nostoc sp. NMS1]|uniref:hypothetical protein n=1 Tax=Nostoc sp. NMS1 TaxID=2815388 RepID=UPI0025D25E01|nr:hypothetical protein [Nostoc sp. NMS1]
MRSSLRDAVLSTIDVLSYSLCRTEFILLAVAGRLENQLNYYGMGKIKLPLKMVKKPRM